jgi:hypothetical protein
VLETGIAKGRVGLENYKEIVGPLQVCEVRYSVGINTNYAVDCCTELSKYLLNDKRASQYVMYTIFC